MDSNALAMADFDRSQLFMLAGFVMLGWVLARRTIGRRKKLVRQGRESDAALRKLRQPISHSVPLCDAPKETQRWQVAMFDLQRELKADLDTRIAVVQSLLRQADGKICELREMKSELVSQASLVNAEGAPVVNAGDAPKPISAKVPSSNRKQIEQMIAAGHTCEHVAASLSVALGEVELIASTVTRTGGVSGPPERTTRTPQ